MNSIIKTINSFRPALVGLMEAAQERNMKVHVLAAVIVIGLAAWLGISRFEWMILFILIGLVWAAEMINTGIEELANITRDELKLSYAATRRTRDLTAGAVLVLAFFAAIVGIMIFGPKLLLKL